MIGRNLVKLNKIDDVISNFKLCPHNRHVDVVTTKEGEVLIDSIVVGP